MYYKILGFQIMSDFMITYEHFNLIKTKKFGHH